MKTLTYTHNLDLKNGGLTFSIANRLQILAKSGHDAHVITHGFLTHPQLTPDGYTHANVYLETATKQGQAVEPPGLHYPNELCYPDKGTNNVRVFVQGEYRQYREYTAAGRLQSIDCFEVPWRRTCKYLFHEGELCKVVHMNQNNEPQLAKYLRGSNCYLTTVVDSKTWQDKTVFDHTTQTEQDSESFKEKFVCRYILDHEIPFVFVDKRGDVEMFLRIKERLPWIRLVFVLHSSHYKDPLRRLGLHPTLDSVFRNLEKFERVLTLTETQRRKLAETFGDERKFMTLGCGLSLESRENTATSRTKFVAIGRYEPVKNMTEMIEIYCLVHEMIPDFRLDLYGYGSERSKLEMLAKGRNIGVHDFTRNPREIMQRSSGFLMTSQYEGLGRVLLEAFDSQLPIFSYDVDFGPRDVIIDYDNGLVIPNRDKVEMARKIVEYVQGKFDFRFSQKCSERFPESKFVESLLGVLG